MVKILVTSKYSFSYSVIKWLLLNSLTDDKTLDQSNLKAFAVNKINGCQKSNLVLGRTENIVGKEENAGYQHFLLFPRYFQTAFFLKVVKSRNCVVKGCLAWGFCSKWLTLSQTILTFNNPYINNFWKLFRKENAGNKHFLLFPNYFSSPITDRNHHLSDTCPWEWAYYCIVWLKSKINVCSTWIALWLSSVHIILDLWNTITNDSVKTFTGGEIYFHAILYQMWLKVKMHITKCKKLNKIRLCCKEFKYCCK